MFPMPSVGPAASDRDPTPATQVPSEGDRGADFARAVEIFLAGLQAESRSSAPGPSAGEAAEA
jgi:hypothetical protein